jgi:uncharacterized protein YerC
MGGDRTCPDDCVLAVWANLPPNDRKAQRKRIAEKLYKQGFTMEQIATQLSVSHMTIVRDLKEFEHDVQTQPRTSKRGRKGEGRAKGSGKTNKLNPQRRKNNSVAAEAAAQTILDEGKTYSNVEKETGLSNIVLRSAVAREEGRREAEPTITPDMLSITAQQKLALAIKQHKQKLDAAFHQAVNARVKTWLEDTILPQHRKEQIEAKKIMAARRGIMDKATFNKIRRALHPDSRLSISERMLGEAFDAFMALEKRLLNEENSPTSFGNLPNTMAEWDAARARTNAKVATGAVKRT